MKEIVTRYRNKDITIIWKSALCQHSTLCWKGEHGLLSVFNPAIRPWINPEGAATENIIRQINACPSGALSFFYNEDESEHQDTK